MNILYVMIGGAFGTLLRYFVSKVITWQQYPIATLSVNALGSLLLGYIFAKYSTSQHQLYLALGVGFCGGFTTFSTFSLELVKMLQAANYLQFIIYLSLSIILGLIGVFAGTYLAKLV